MFYGGLQMNKLQQLNTSIHHISVMAITIAIFSTGSLYAFSDMNDSIAQDKANKTLQKRIDSLELRFEKMVIDQNEAKKTVFDWSRGLFANVSFDINNFDFEGITTLGYMFCKTRKNNDILSPVIRFGKMQISQENNAIRAEPEHFFISIGYQRLHQTAERVSFLNGVYLNVAPDFTNHELFGAGMEYANSLDFWYSESSALGIGIFGRCTFVLGENDPWYETNGVTYQAGFRITYTQCFLKHNAKNRSK
jgi:hypothetical protein